MTVPRCLELPDQREQPTSTRFPVLCFPLDRFKPVHASALHHRQQKGAADIRPAASLLKPYSCN